MKLFNDRRVLGTVLGTFLFICCLLFFTYAYYVWRSDNTLMNITISDFYLNCVNGPDVNVSNIGPVLNYQDGVEAEFTVSNPSNDSGFFNVVLNITSISDNLKVGSFKYKLVKDNTGGTNYDYNNPVVEGNFEDFVIGENNVADNISVAGNSSYSFQFIVYIDGNMYNSNNMQDNSLVAGLEFGNCTVSN